MFPRVHEGIPLRLWSVRFVESSSFRDPSGFVYREDGVLLRQVNEPYRQDWTALNETGLASELMDAGLLVRHVEKVAGPGAVATIEPENIPFISFPYEWSFSQLKDAALCTLSIQKRAFGKGMILKDASAYNIQFLRGKPTLIDTLSFETYTEGEPWRAYRQFCRHFLGPLALMAHVGPEGGLMLRDHIDGLPLGFVSKALPGKTRFHPGLAMHLHLHAKAESSAGGSVGKGRRVSKIGLQGLIESLESTVRGLTWKPEGTVWADYYAATNYTDDSMADKRRLVRELLNSIEPYPTKIWDLGANTGEFSKIAGERCDVIAFDIDPGAVERHYLSVRANGGGRVLPLVQDLTNPSPGIGWANQERKSLADRGSADGLLALALVHHLAIGNNVPLPMIFEYFGQLGEWLVIEFVPKEDSQTQRLLSAKPDVFPSYTQEGFEKAATGRFSLERREKIEGTLRTLYLLRRSS